MVNEKRLVDMFVRLVEIDSLSKHEGKIKDFIKNHFTARGLSVEEDDAANLINGQSGNLLVKVAGTVNKPPLLFAAHMDTVKPGIGIKAVIGDDMIIRSQGDTILGSDDKAAIAALLEVYDVIAEQNLSHPPLELLFTVGEEHGLMGAKIFNFDRLEAKIGYVLDDGNDPGTIVIKSPCQNEIDYYIKGCAAHAGMNPEKGINAILLAAKALAVMPNGRIDEDTTCNFGLIKGGLARNIVAPYCHIKGEARSQTREKLDQLTLKLEKIFINEIEKLGGEAEVYVKFLYPEISLKPEEEVVKRAMRAISKLRLEPRFAATGGGSDANIINGRGIRCANLGVGMKNVHTTDEYISIAHLVQDVQIILEIIKESC
ncbi:MAG: M20/M25/M40 family metallo-hydrolase [Syntrophomonadaceae bacterium]